MGAKITGYVPFMRFNRDGSQTRMLKVQYVTDDGIEDDVDVEKDTATKETIVAAIREDMKSLSGLVGQKV